MRALLDSTIVIDYLSGLEPAREEIARYDGPAISLVTWTEVLVGALDKTEDERLRRFLRRFGRIGIDEAVVDEAIALRRGHRVKLSNAIIWATARAQSILLVTRNTRDFPADEPGIRFPYAL